LIRLDRLHTRTAKRRSMQIDVARTTVRHHKTEALLVVEELDLAFDHRTGRGAVAMMVAAAKAATAKPAAATETAAAAPEAATAAAKSVVAIAIAVTTAIAKAAAAEITARSTRRRSLCGGKVHAVDVHHLKSALSVGQVADNGGALRHLAMACRLKRGGVTESVTTIVQCDETVPLGRVKPLHFARRRRLRERPRPLVIEMSHVNRRHTPSRLMINNVPNVRLCAGRIGYDDYRNRGPASRP